MIQSECGKVRKIIVALEIYTLVKKEIYKKDNFHEFERSLQYI